MNAQLFRLGLGGGVSHNTVPTRAFDAGSYGKTNFSTALTGHYMLSPHFQLGAAFSVTKWTTNSDVALLADNGTSLGTQSVKYVVANPAITAGLEFNYLCPFEPRYADFVRGELYVGVAFGGVGTGGDGNNVLSRANERTPREYVYRSEFHYQGGYGYYTGLQVGYSYYFSERIGIDANVAGRWASMKTKDGRYQGRNERYDLFWFPVTIGIKFRLGTDNGPY